jgi:hypothetical protein
MAAEDVASAVARISVGSPVNGVVEVAGPERFQLDELARLDLEARHDLREVVTDREKVVASETLVLLARGHRLPRLDLAERNFTNLHDRMRDHSFQPTAS